MRVWQPAVAIAALVGAVLVSTQAPLTATAAPQVAEAPSLDYVSDYLSFVGADDRGRVAFALDTNRGRDGEAFQAEHFVILHDEGQGWVGLRGNGLYDNIGQRLLDIPDSPFFQFAGTPRSGLTITSEKNDLVLRVGPIPERLSRSHGGGRFWMGSAPAVLEWAGRLLRGRVIYEFLHLPDFNRLTRTYWGLWKDFQGFYLSAGEAGDLYLHSQQSERLAPLAGELVGFAVLDGRDEGMAGLECRVQDRQLALGFYRWPSAWSIGWRGESSVATVELALSERTVLANWVIGGFAMGIVKGEVVRNGRPYPLYGLVELLM